MTALLFFALILIQFIPKKKRNISAQYSNYSIENVHTVPVEVDNILKNSCYDCHSNNSNYPWYTNIQPFSMWIDHHINEGKEELNFSEFGAYSVRRQYHKLHEIIEQVQENEMPLSSYTLIHTKAKLNDADKNNVVRWATSLKDSFIHVYPKDSLEKSMRH